MLKRLARAMLLASFWMQPAISVADCTAVDFMTLPLPASAEDPIAVAIMRAYPGVLVDGDMVVLPGGMRLAMGRDDNRPPQDRLADPSFREQFHDTYPLRFDLAARNVPWFDPGRPRIEALFQALYGASEAEVQASLQKTKITGKAAATFLMTTKQGVACQMAAALADIANLPMDWGPAFTAVGGSFNWRKIAGTNRYSAHSYGIAFDLNADLGGYWRWSKRPEGDAGPYDNRIPRDIVEVFERYGFIWGGKWHHFDGMHFEYRPELILHARLTGR